MTTKRLIEIYSEILPPSFWWTPESFVGGTIEYVVETANCLSNRGYDVIVYKDGNNQMYGNWNNVQYLPRYMYQGKDIVLACNSRPPKLGKRNIYWTNWYHNRDKNHLDFDERVVVSKYYQSLYGPNSRVIYHACWPKKYQNPIKEKGSCLYSSSPDRGKDFINQIWPDVYKRTGAKLITTYNKNITEDEMTDIYRRSQFWLHPCQGIELFCISGYKAQAAKCIPVYVPNMALAETILFGIKTTIGRFKEDLISAINNPPNIPNIYFKDWDDVTDDLEQLII